MKLGKDIALNLTSLLLACDSSGFLKHAVNKTVIMDDKSTSLSMINRHRQSWTFNVTKYYQFNICLE